MILEDEGYIVELASDGLKALEAIAANKPDMILLDVMMPNMSGTQVLKELQDDKDHAEIPVIVMTAINGMAGGRILNGDNEIVEKPFDVHDLLNKIALTMYRVREKDNEQE